MNYLMAWPLFLIRQFVSSCTRVSLLVVKMLRGLTISSFPASSHRPGIFQYARIDIQDIQDMKRPTSLRTPPWGPGMSEVLDPVYLSARKNSNFRFIDSWWSRPSIGHF